MRIGGVGVSVSTHAAGMSALWHDAALDDEGLPLRRLNIPTVEKKIEDMPLPAEDHLLPDGYADPFARMDAAYDVAAAQMDRGIKGTEFLHGKPPPQGISNSLAIHELDAERRTDVHVASRTQAVEVGDRSRPMDNKIKEDARVERETVRQIGQASSQIGGQLPDAVATAARKEAERAAEALHMAESLGIPAALTPMAASQMLQAVAMPAAVTNAVTAAGAVAGAADVVGVGIAQGLSEEPQIVRRALRRPTKAPDHPDDE